MNFLISFEINNYFSSVWSLLFYVSIKREMKLVIIKEYQWYDLSMNFYLAFFFQG
jgi:hypothetical protein